MESTSCTTDKVYNSSTLAVLEMHYTMAPTLGLNIDYTQETIHTQRVSEGI